MISPLRLCATALLLATPLAACEPLSTANQSNLDTTPGRREAPVVVQVSVEPQRADCQGMMPMKCLIVDGEFFYDSIEGFTHEAGTSYQLEIERSPRAAPGEILMDVGYYKYRLIRIVSATQ